VTVSALNRYFGLLTLLATRLAGATDSAKNKTYSTVDNSLTTQTGQLTFVTTNPRQSTGAVVAEYTSLVKFEI
jgi:hypothetical protein